MKPYKVIEPIKLEGISGGLVFFSPGDVVEIIAEPDEDGDVLAVRRDPGRLTGGLHQYISMESLEPID